MMIGPGTNMTEFWDEIDWLLYIISYNVQLVHINATSILGLIKLPTRTGNRPRQSEASRTPLPIIQHNSNGKDRNEIWPKNPHRNLHKLRHKPLHVLAMSLPIINSWKLNVRNILS